MKNLYKFIWVYIAYLFQVLVLNEVIILDATPDIIFVVLVIYAVSCDYMLSAALGGFAGLLTDVLTGKVFGVYTLVYMYFALIVCLLTNKKSENSPIIVGVICFLSITATRFALSILRSILGYGTQVLQILSEIVVQGVFGFVCALVVVYLIQKKRAKAESDTDETTREVQM